MNWKCDVCDSHTDEPETVCCVCGQARSTESIREGKRRIREARASIVNKVVYEKAYKISRFVFVSGWISSLSAVALAMILKLCQGDIGSLITNLGAVFGHMWTGIVTAATVNGWSVTNEMLALPISDIRQSAVAVFTHWGVSLSDFTTVFQRVFTDTAFRNVGYGFAQSGVRLFRLSGENLAAMLSLIGLLLPNVMQQLTNVADVVKSVFQNVKEFFS